MQPGTGHANTSISARSEPSFGRPLARGSSRGSKAPSSLVSLLLAVLLTSDLGLAGPLRRLESGLSERLSYHCNKAVPAVSSRLRSMALGADCSTPLVRSTAGTGSMSGRAGEIVSSSPYASCRCWLTAAVRFSRQFAGTGTLRRAAAACTALAHMMSLPWVRQKATRCLMACHMYKCSRAGACIDMLQTYLFPCSLAEVTHATAQDLWRAS